MSEKIINENIQLPTGRLLIWLFRRFEDDLLLALAKEGFNDITASHLNLIRHLNPEGMKLSALAQDAALSKQAITKIAGNLSNKSYIEIIDSSQDKRAKIIRFTPKGNRLITTAMSIVKNIEQHYLNVLGEQQYLALRQALIELNKEENHYGTTD